ncbi:MAG: GIY-YIG nuclease family protein [Candidatus Peregrinibacteria bacterium]
MPYYFYLARCCDDSLYAGSCVDLKEREKCHNDGKGAKYTRSRRPIQFVYHEQFSTLAEARRREAEVKTWNKEKKEQLVAG